MGLSYLTEVGNATSILFFPSKNSFFYNLQAVIYDKKLLREVVEVSNVSHRQSRCWTRINSADWHVLNICGTSWRSPKYTGNIHGMFVAGVVRKRKGFFSMLTLSKKKTNQHRTLHLAPQRSGFMVDPNGICVMVVRYCMNIPKYTLIGYIFLSNRGW